MKLASSLLSIVANKMGYQELRAKQQEAILALMKGWDVFVALPTATGCGKSLCYSVFPGVFDAVRSESGQQSVAINAVVCGVAVLCSWLNVSETMGSLWQSFSNISVTILRNGNSTRRLCSGRSTNKHKAHAILSAKKTRWCRIPVFHEKRATVTRRFYFRSCA